MIRSTTMANQSAYCSPADSELEKGVFPSVRRSKRSEKMKRVEWPVREIQKLSGQTCT